MIKGEYIFYQDGKEIGRSQNTITKFGKRLQTQTQDSDLNSIGFPSHLVALIL